MHIKGLILAFIAVAGLVGYVAVRDPWLELVEILAIMALVGGMPDPGPDSSTAYKWAYRSSHLFFNMASHFFSHESAWKSLEPKAAELGKRTDAGE